MWKCVLAQCNSANSLTVKLSDLQEDVITENSYEFLMGKPFSRVTQW